MADPGSLVGTVSLALQVAQGLKVYYTQFRSYHDDIRAVVERVERLDGILRVLEEPVLRLERDIQLSHEIRMCIEKIADAVRELDRYKRKCGEVENKPETLKKKVVHVTHRIAYPFRKDTLEGLQKLLDRVLQNLQVVMQILGLDTTLRFQAQAESYATTTHQGLTMVRKQQSYQTELLEDHSIQLLSLKAQVDGMRNLFEQIVLDAKPKPAPALLKNTCDAYTEIAKERQLIRSTVKQSSQSLEKDRDQALVDSGCRCSRSARKLKKPPRRRFIPIFWFDDADHLPSCPCYKLSEVSRTVNVEIAAWGKKVGWLIQANLTWSDQSMNAHIRYRNLVSNRSPAFLLLDALSRILWCTPEDAMLNAWSLTLDGLSRLLVEQRIGIRDTLSNGDVLAHLFMIVLGRSFYKNIEKTKLLDLMRQVLTSFRELGFEFDQRSESHGHALDSFIWEMADDAEHLNSVVPILMDLGDSWVYDQNIAMLRTEYIGFNRLKLRDNAYRVLASVVQSGQDDPISTSILLRSVSDLLRSLQGFVAQDGLGLLYLHMSADWTQGMDILLHHGLRNDQLDKDGQSAVDYAICFGNLDSLELLLQKGAPITKGTWSLVLESEYFTNGQGIQMIAKALWDQRYRSNSTGSSIDYDELYHETPFFTVHAVQALHDAGFLDVDICLCKQGTPLWSNAGRLTFSNPHDDDVKREIQLLAWFVNHGAQFDAMHPCYHTMPLHKIAEGLAYCELDPWAFRIPVPSCGKHRGVISQAMDDSSLDFVRTIFQSTISDSCRCMCSLGGCNVVTSALRIVRREFGFGDENRRQGRTDFELQRQLLNMITTLLPPAVCQEKILSASVIRVLTFDRLELTHTCHFIDKWDFPWFPSDEEITETHFVEKVDIELLEELLCEFHNAWEEQHGDILSFIDGYWKTRMDEVMAEKNAPYAADELARMDSLGIKIERYGPDLPLRSPRERLTRLEIFQEYIKRLLAGEDLEYHNFEMRYQILH